MQCMHDTTIAKFHSRVIIATVAVSVLTTVLFFLRNDRRPDEGCYCMHSITRFAIVLSVTASTPVLAQTPPANTMMGALRTCLAIADDAQRLACTDRAARTLVDAEQRRDIVIVARDEIRKSRKSLFGLNLGSGDLFAGRDTPAERIEALDTTVQAATRERYDRWTLTLAEGGRWATTEAWVGDLDPKPGMAVSIHRAALGSYVLRAKGFRAVKVQRVN
jgi:hypothetical protein